MVEGPLAGGHLGFKVEQIGSSDYSLGNLIPQVITEVGTYEAQYHRSNPVITAAKYRLTV